MKLRSLRVNGFKSFADRTDIEFHEGITFPAEQTNFAQERFGVELRARWEWDLR